MRRKRQGFSLIEMLVVIMIIGILAASLLGVGGRVRVLVWKVRAHDTAKQVSTAWMLYLRENRRFPVTSSGNEIAIRSMSAENCMLLNLKQTFLETKKEEMSRTGDEGSGVLDPWGWRALKAGKRELALQRQIQVSLDNGEVNGTANNSAGAIANGAQAKKDSNAYDGWVPDNDGVNEKSDPTHKDEVRATVVSWSWGLDVDHPKDDIVAR